MYRSELERINDNAILTGAEIIDLGQGSGTYSYYINNNLTDLLDLFQYSDDVRFNDYEGVISGSPKNDASYEYRINTFYPFKKLRIKAVQMYKEWYNINIFYSFDQKNWNEIACTGGSDTVQIFDGVISGDGKTSKEIYIKVTYDKSDSKEIELFGLRSLEISGDLNMNVK